MRSRNPFDSAPVRNYTNDRRPMNYTNDRTSMPISSIKPKTEKYFTKREAKGKRKKGRRTSKRRILYKTRS